MYLRLLPKPCVLLSIVSSNKTTSRPKIACTWDYWVIDYPTLAIIAVWQPANGFEVGRRWTPFCNKWAPCSTPTNSSNGWFLPTLLHARAHASDEFWSQTQVETQPFRLDILQEKEAVCAHHYEWRRTLLHQSHRRGQSQTWPTPQLGRVQKRQKDPSRTCSRPSSQNESSPRFVWVWRTPSLLSCSFSLGQSNSSLWWHAWVCCDVVWPTLTKAACPPLWQLLL